MFPFYWVGAAFAAGFLSAAMLAFALFARLLNVADDARASIVPGLVEGFRDWTREGAEAVRRAISPQSPDAAAPTMLDDPGVLVPTERVRGHVA